MNKSELRREKRYKTYVNYVQKDFVNRCYVVYR
jgi:hypothetical protein